MNRVDIVKEALATGEAGDTKKLSNLVTDDMTFEGPVPEPQPKAAYLGMIGALTTALPDWKFNASDFVEKGETVSVTLNITGTHTGTLTLPMLPNPIPATGKHIQLPGERFEFTLKGDKISRIHGEVVPDGGVMGLLAQLGVTLPASV